MNSSFRLLLLLCITANLIMACGNSTNSPSTSTPPQATGTSDGGGGIVGTSKEQQVERAIADARLMLESKTPFLVLTSTKKNPSIGVGQVLAKVFDIEFRKLGLPGNQSIAFERNESYKNPLSSKLKNLDVILRSQGSCRAPDKEHPDASVAQSSYNTSLCFNIKRLTRIPPDSLDKQILALWVHEIVHMEGYGEHLAVATQNYITSIDSEFRLDHLNPGSQVIQNLLTKLRKQSRRFAFPNEQSLKKVDGLNLILQSITENLENNPSLTLCNPIESDFNRTALMRNLKLILYLSNNYINSDPEILNSVSAEYDLITFNIIGSFSLMRGCETKKEKICSAGSRDPSLTFSRNTLHLYQDVAALLARYSYSKKFLDVFIDDRSIFFMSLSTELTDEQNLELNQDRADLVNHLVNEISLHISTTITSIQKLRAEVNDPKLIARCELKDQWITTTSQTLNNLEAQMEELRTMTKEKFKVLNQVNGKEGLAEEFKRSFPEGWKKLFSDETIETFMRMIRMAYSIS